MKRAQPDNMSANLASVATLSNITTRDDRADLESVGRLSGVVGDCKPSLEQTPSGPSEGDDAAQRMADQLQRNISGASFTGSMGLSPSEIKVLRLNSCEVNEIAKKVTIDNPEDGSGKEDDEDDKEDDQEGGSVAEDAQDTSEALWSQVRFFRGRVQDLEGVEAELLKEKTHTDTLTKQNKTLAQELEIAKEKVKEFEKQTKVQREKSQEPDDRDFEFKFCWIREKQHAEALTAELRNANEEKAEAQAEALRWKEKFKALYEGCTAVANPLAYPVPDTSPTTLYDKETRLKEQDEQVAVGNDDPNAPPSNAGAKGAIMPDPNGAEDASVDDSKQVKKADAAMDVDTTAKKAKKDEGTSPAADATNGLKRKAAEDTTAMDDDTEAADGATAADTKKTKTAWRSFRLSIPVMDGMSMNGNRQKGYKKQDLNWGNVCIPDEQSCAVALLMLTMWCPRKAGVWCTFTSPPSERNESLESYLKTKIYPNASCATRLCTSMITGSVNYKEEEGKLFQIIKNAPAECGALSTKEWIRYLDKVDRVNGKKDAWTTFFRVSSSHLRGMFEYPNSNSTCDKHLTTMTCVKTRGNGQDTNPGGILKMFYTPNSSMSWCLPMALDGMQN